MSNYLNTLITAIQYNKKEQMWVYFTIANLRTISKTILEEFCQVRFESASQSTKEPHNKGKIREYSVLL